jgi:DNA-directed RNA polymerase I subunit RPA49
MYSRDPAAAADVSQQQTLVAGETADVEFFSTNRDRATGEGNDCAYVAGVYDPSTNSVHLSAAPLYLLVHRVKRARTAEDVVAPGSTLWKAKRNDLGETFGTRKAKSQIRAEERNKVDITAMAGVRGSLMDSIGGIEKDNGPTAPSEFIPKPNLETKVVSEVYARSAIIPDSEWSAVDVHRIAATADDRARSDLLPFKKSRWIETKMRVAVEGPSNTKKSSL